MADAAVQPRKARRELKKMVQAALAADRVTLGASGTVYATKLVNWDEPVSALCAAVMAAFPSAVLESAEKSLGSGTQAIVRLRFRLGSCTGREEDLESDTRIVVLERTRGCRPNGREHDQGIQSQRQSPA